LESDSAAQVATSLAIASNTTATTKEQCFANYIQYILDAYKEGSGTGVVTSSPPGIGCGADCRGVFTSGAPVTLTPVAGQNSLFSGWQGACDAGGQVTMDADKYCVALFNSIIDFSGTPRTGTAPLEVVFTDLSSNSPTGWFWGFGDGGTSLVQSPSHTYLWPGSYPVSLAVTGPGGPGSITKDDYVTVNCEQGVHPVRYGTPPSTWIPSDSIQSAYDAAADGNYIEPLSLTFEGNLSFTQNKSVTLKGGYNCEYSSSGAFTTVRGAVTIGGPASGTGGVTVVNIVIR
jgi:PKD repeat protein